MPIFCRMGYRASSLNAVMSSPKTNTRPESGRNSPSAIFSNTDLPEAADPSSTLVPLRVSRKLALRSTGVSSRVSQTRSNSSTTSELRSSVMT